MMGEMKQLKSLSQVHDGFMPFFVTSTCCFTVGHFCTSWYVNFVSQVRSVQGMQGIVGRMMRVESPSQVRDGFVPSLIPWLPYSWSFFSRACRVQGMMGGTMRVESLSQVRDGFMLFFVTSTCTYDNPGCLTVGHFVLLVCAL